MYFCEQKIISDNIIIMSFLTILSIAVALSMDSFSISICKGLITKKFSFKTAILCGLWFGGFQALMPLIGWLLGVKFQNHIERFDHWIAFLLLSFIGAKMIYEAFHEDEDADSDTLGVSELFILAIATSIDALVIGIVFAMLEIGTAGIFYNISIIGLTTFILSVFGVFVGNKFGAVYKNKAELAGGVILVLLGLKILLEHLGLIRTLF